MNSSSSNQIQVKQVGTMVESVEVHIQSSTMVELTLIDMHTDKESTKINVIFNKEEWDRFKRAVNIL